MLADVLYQLGSLTLEENRAVGEVAGAAVAQGLGAAGHGAPDACPRCGRPTFVRKDRGAEAPGACCAGWCGRAFPAKTMSLVSGPLATPQGEKPRRAGAE